MYSIVDGRRGVTVLCKREREGGEFLAKRDYKILGTVTRTLVLVLVTHLIGRKSFLVFCPSDRIVIIFPPRNPIFKQIDS